MNQTIKISDMAVSSQVDDVLVTYSLGSCIGVVLYDPIAKIGGMIHCLLPLSKANPEKAKVNPSMYTDSGFVELLATILALGANKGRLIVKVAGCGAPMDKNGRFKIGDRNIAVLRKLLWKNKMMISGEDVGGTKPRTMRLYMDSGITTVTTNREATEI